jgi:RHS repeat-associated protein
LPTRNVTYTLDKAGDYTCNPVITFSLQQDLEGSVTHVTDADGHVIERYRYDAFGAPTIYPPSPSATPRPASIVSNRFLFTGREWAAAFGFYEYRARAYHPGLGRFMSEDPKGVDAGDYNLFRYCHNDPVDLTDPMGLEYNDPYEGSPNRFEMVGTITHPGVDRYGETPFDRRIAVTPVGNELRLTRYDVTVGKRYIATETRSWGNRRDAAIQATKEHEDKHVAIAKKVYEQYDKMIGKTIGRIDPNQDPYRTAVREAKRLANEFDAKTQSHEPKSEWRDIMKREDDGNTRHNFSYNHQQQQFQQQYRQFENPRTLYFIQIVH